MTDQGEQGATGRRWKISVPLVALGAASLVYGVIDHFTEAIIAGLVLIVVFGATAAGARRVTFGSPLVKGQTEFKASTPPSEPGRRVYLPRGWRSKTKKR